MTGGPAAAGLVAPRAVLAADRATTSGPNGPSGPPGAGATADAQPRLRIGEAAAAAGVSTRTLRYYQELGLLSPTRTASGGARRYSDEDVSRVHRIRHLRDLVGLDLTEVGRVLAAEDRLAELRREWVEAPERQPDVLREAVEINAEMQSIVRAKQQALRDFLAGLEERAEAYRALLAAREADAPPPAAEVAVAARP